MYPSFLFSPRKPIISAACPGPSVVRMTSPSVIFSRETLGAISHALPRTSIPLSVRSQRTQYPLMGAAKTKPGNTEAARNMRETNDCLKAICQIPKDRIVSVTSLSTRLHVSLDAQLASDTGREICRYSTPPTRPSSSLKKFLRT